MKNVIRLSLLAFLLSSIFLLFGCTKSAQPPLPESTQTETTTPVKTPEPEPAKVAVPAVKLGDYFPTAAGSTWDYQGTGNEYASFSRKIIFTQGNLAQISEDNGGTVITSVYKVTSSEVSQVSSVVGDSESSTNYLKIPSTENLVILKTPLLVGTKWIANGDREIVGMNTTVTTPAGSYTQCLKVKITYKGSTVYEYYKKGVGMVKREFISGGAMISSSLKKHT